MVDEQGAPRRSRLRIDPSDLALEVVSIVVAILLAFAVNEWRDHAKAQARAHDVLGSIRTEMAANRIQLVAVMPHHVAVHRAFNSVRHSKGSRFTFEQLGRVFQDSNPNGYTPFNGEATAWDLARATPVLEDVDYRIRAMLERGYKEQTFLSSYGDRILSDLHFGAAPPNADYFPVAISFTLDAADVIASEDRLLKLYDRTLPALDAALR